MRSAVKKNTQRWDPPRWPLHRVYIVNIAFFRRAVSFEHTFADGTVSSRKTWYQPPCVNVFFSLAFSKKRRIHFMYIIICCLLFTFSLTVRYGGISFGFIISVFLLLIFFRFFLGWKWNSTQFYSFLRLPLIVVVVIWSDTLRAVGYFLYYFLCFQARLCVNYEPV